MAPNRTPALYVSLLMVSCQCRWTSAPLREKSSYRSPLEVDVHRLEVLRV